MFLLIEVSTLFNEESAEIQIHLMFLLILYNISVVIHHIYSNTSHVLINRDYIQAKSDKKYKFKYISCSY